MGAARSIGSVLATGFVIGASPVLMAGGIVYLWLRYLEAMDSQDAQ